MLTRLNCGDFTIHTKIKSLCCIPETNIMLDVDYILIKKNKELYNVTIITGAIYLPIFILKILRINS